MTRSLLLFVTLLAGASPLPAQQPLASDRDFFETRVRPLLVEHCHGCHSTQAKKQRGGLLLDSRAAILNGGDSGAVVVPGKPDMSLLVRAVSYQNERVQMPPKGKLKEHDIALLAEWVRRGAPFPDTATTTSVQRTIDIAAGKKFWSFQPLRSLPAPAVHNGAWARSRIDSFLLADMDRAGLKPSLEADRRTLIRRWQADEIEIDPANECPAVSLE